MNLINKEEVAFQVSRLIGSTEQEVHDFIDNNDLKYSDLRAFASLAGRFPNEEEVHIIGNRGIDVLLGEMFGFDAIKGIN